MISTYTLPTGALQAVRARFRYNGSAASCGAGAYDDHRVREGEAREPPPSSLRYTSATDRAAQMGPSSVKSSAERRLR